MKAQRSRWYEIQRYFKYFFSASGFTAQSPRWTLSPEALQSAAIARGENHLPAIFIQGIMRRSGTVYVGELLRRHPDVQAFPYELWELPALTFSERIYQLQQEFMLEYPFNHDRLSDADFLAFFGGGLMAFLHASLPETKHVLMKMPSVQYLDVFPLMFPFEKMLILIRDGRDVIHSTLKTWPQLNFIQVCLRWRRSANMVTEYLRLAESKQVPQTRLFRYEDALAEPHQFIEQLCRQVGLDPASYPYDEIESIRVIGSSKLETNKVRWEHIPRPDSFRPTAYWHDWSRWRKFIFKTIAGQSLIDLGYTGDNSW